MFVPSESIFAELHDGFDDIVQKAFRSKVVIVSETVGPLWPSRSEIRARSGTTPSSSSSKMVRRYISAVSIRSLTRRNY